MNKQVIELGFLSDRFFKWVRVNFALVFIMLLGFVSQSKVRSRMSAFVAQRILRVLNNKVRGVMKKKIRRLKQSVAGVMWGNGLSRFASYFFVAALFLSQAGYATEEANPKPIFKLIKGQGVEVCEAYLKRLNATEFLDNDPIKSRVHEPLLEGFIDLQPIPLTAEQIQTLYPKINAFDYVQDQDAFSDKKQQSLEHRQKEQKESLERVNLYIERHKKAPFVRYQVLLDLDNDGIADDTVIKNQNSVYIVDNSLSRINEQRMKMIFANQKVLQWITIKSFPPLAYPINVFNYKGQYYFDGFIDLAVMDSHPRVVTLYLENKPLTLGVFFSRKNQTKKICEYQWMPPINNRNSMRFFDDWMEEE
jgi:hypothetical protein